MGIWVHLWESLLRLVYPVCWSDYAHRFTVVESRFAAPNLLGLNPQDYTGDVEVNQYPQHIYGGGNEWGRHEGRVKLEGFEQEG